MSRIRPEVAHAINGVAGRLFALNKPPAPWVDSVFANQTWASEGRRVKGYGSGATLRVEMRFDDQCRNGHNSFSITGDIRGPRGQDIAGGCVHDDIAAVFPELAPLIRWHLTSTDGPMHYLANVTYLAGDLDHNGRRAGEPSSFDFGVRFGTSPVTVILKKAFHDWLNAAEAFNAAALKSNPAYVHFEPVSVALKRDDGAYKLSDKFTFQGYDVEWHSCPFDNAREVEEFGAALLLPHEFVKVPTAWSEGKARQTDAARRVAVWPDATDAQLCAPRDELRGALTDRLPALLAEFRTDMEAAGFVWSAAGVAESSTKS